jgi:thymidylate synthase
MTTRPIRSQYEDFMRHVNEHGVFKADRTGTGTTSVFGHQMRFDLNEGFPLVTTKKVHLRSIIQELLWFLTGSSNNNWLRERGVTIWDEWAREDGDLGPVYGVQWRRWRKPLIRINKVVLQNHDQLLELIDGIKTDPYSRRHIITAWNPGELDIMALPPCHMMAQFYVNNGKLSCQMYQRSADMFLGVPFNIASYALFTHMIAQVCNLEVSELIITLGDAHIYNNHFEQVKEQLKRDPKPLATLELNSEISVITEFDMEDIELAGYESHEAIKAPMAR